jgi:hypothetical protein
MDETNKDYILLYSFLEAYDQSRNMLNGCQFDDGELFVLINNYHENSLNV